MRLDRRVAERTGAPRRVVGHWIRAGRVSVNGAAATDAGARLSPGDVVTVDGAPLPEPPPPVALFHKPVGVQSVVTDPHGRACLGTAAAELLHAGLHPVGRLDADTDGLLLFAADGALTQFLLHPRRAIERVYEARVSPPATAALAGALDAGVETAEGVFRGEVRGMDGDRVTLAVWEGKHRMVRRMLANAGHPVQALRRLSYGPFVLGGLEAGAWREATAEELEALREMRG